MIRLARMCPETLGGLCEWKESRPGVFYCVNCFAQAFAKPEDPKPRKKQQKRKRKSTRA